MTAKQAVKAVGKDPKSQAVQYFGVGHQGLKFRVQYLR